MPAKLVCHNFPTPALPHTFFSYRVSATTILRYLQPRVKMVKVDSVIEINERFASERHERIVCVFAGATSGIGMGTLQRLATMLYSSTFYVLGRSESRFQGRLEKLREESPSCNFIFIETQVSRISGIDAACGNIISEQQKVDYLCMSPGGMPFGGAVCRYRFLSYMPITKLIKI